VTEEEMKQLRPDVFKEGADTKSKVLSEIVPGVPLIVPSLAWKHYLFFLLLFHCFLR